MGLGLLGSLGKPTSNTTSRSIHCPYNQTDPPAFTSRIAFPWCNSFGRSTVISLFVCGRAGSTRGAHFFSVAVVPFSRRPLGDDPAAPSRSPSFRASHRHMVGDDGRRACCYCCPSLLFFPAAISPTGSPDILQSDTKSSTCTTVMIIWCTLNQVGRGAFFFIYLQQQSSTFDINANACTLSQWGRRYSSLINPWNPRGSGASC